MCKCLSCNTNESVVDPTYGILNCQPCRDRQASGVSGGIPLEITTEEIKDSRRRYSKDIIQARRGGQLSKEFVDAYPETVKTMIKEGTATVKEANSAKNLWSEDSYYNG